LRRERFVGPQGRGGRFPAPGGLRAEARPWPTSRGSPLSGPLRRPTVVPGDPAPMRTIRWALVAALLACGGGRAHAHEVADPVCGMAVESDEARWKADFAGKTYCFCAKGCRESFIAAPRKYVSVLAATRLAGDARIG